MCLSFRVKQTGFSMPIVVFILVIMALLATAIVQLSSQSNIAAAQEELSNRAFYAAESGAQWAMSRLFFNSGGAADKTFSDTACTAVDGNALNFTQVGLSGCRADLTCTAQTVGSTGYYRIASTGTCGSGQVLGIRIVEVGAKNGG